MPSCTRWYEAATLFVHPTLYEGSSLVTLEAMAHRRAVVALGAGGIPDKVRPGVNGWLVPPGDAVGARRRPERGAWRTPSGSRAWARPAARSSKSEFSWDAAGAATLRMYDELLKGR